MSDRKLKLFSGVNELNIYAPDEENMTMIGIKQNEAIKAGVLLSENQMLGVLNFIKGNSRNNGWVKINSIEDLPKDYNEYWWIHKENGICRETFNKGNKLGDELKMKYMTHWQPVERPIVPVY